MEGEREGQIAKKEEVRSSAVPRTAWPRDVATQSWPVTNSVMGRDEELQHSHLAFAGTSHGSVALVWMLLWIQLSVNSVPPQAFREGPSTATMMSLLAYPTLVAMSLTLI